MEIEIQKQKQTKNLLFFLKASSAIGGLELKYICGHSNDKKKKKLNYRRQNDNLKVTMLFSIINKVTKCIDIITNGVFFSKPKNVHFISKNAISCLFLKNVSPSKRVIDMFYSK